MLILMQTRNSWRIKINAGGHTRVHRYNRRNQSGNDVFNNLLERVILVK